MNKIDYVDILIVEDNSYDAELTVRTLRKQNLTDQIFIVTDGEEALDFIFCRRNFAERISSKPLKVIFLDLKLPKVSGLEVLKEIKSNVETRKIPVVVVTSSKEDSDIKTAYDLGANSYIVKPVDFAEFIHVIGTTGMYWLLVNETQS